MLTKQQRKKLWSDHKMVRAGSVSANFVCAHDRLLWPCPTVKHLYDLQNKERRANYEKGKQKSA